VKLDWISEEARKWWTLGAVAFGLFMIMLDNTVVNVALPAIAADLQILGAVVSFVLVRAHDRGPVPEGVPEVV
jgi:Mg/Co/Ni transporter MgtE